MFFSNRLRRIVLLVSALSLTACTDQIDNKEKSTDHLSSASTASVGGNRDAEPVPAAAQDERTAWLAGIEQSGLVDIAAIDAEVEKIRRDLIIDKYFESLYSSQITAESIENYYRENKEKFTSEQVNIAHILIRTPASFNEEQHAAAATKAHELVSKLHIGEDFATLANLASEDTATANNGGTLGWVSQGQISDGVMESALALDAGEVSDPVIEKYGIHIIKKLSPTRVQAKPLKRVSALISQQLRAGVKQEAVRNLTLAKQ